MGCKVAIPCLSFGLKKPERLCSAATRLLCLKGSQSLPMDPNYNNEIVCALYGVQCKPECSCCGSAGTECPALDKPLTDYSPAPVRTEMDRMELTTQGGYTDKEV